MKKKNKKILISTSCILMLLGLGSITAGILMNNKSNSSNTSSNSQIPNTDNNQKPDEKPNQGQDGNGNNPQPQPEPMPQPEPEPAPENKTEIESVKISGKGIYESGETITITSTINMKHGDVPSGIVYNWYITENGTDRLLEDQHDDTLTLIANVSMQGSSIFLRISWDEKSYESNLINLSVSNKVEPEVQYHVIVDTSSIVYENITNDSAIVKFKIISEQDLPENISITSVLSNRSVTSTGSVERINSKEYNIRFNLDNLSENTTYSLSDIKVNINNKDHDVSTEKAISFKTLKSNDTVITVTIDQHQLESNINSNIVNITFDQVLPSNVGKKIRVVFTNKGTNFNSDTLPLENGKKSYSLNINNLSDSGEYSFKQVEIENGGSWQKVNSDANINCTFNKKVQEQTPPPSDEQHYSNKPLDEYGNVYRLQTANELFKDTNIQEYNNNSLTEQSLIPLNENYRDYFEVLKSNNIEEPSKAVIPDGLKVVNNFSTSKFVPADQNKLKLAITKPDDVTIASAKILVKSFDQEHPWSKIITLNLNGNYWELDPSELSQLQNKYVYTNLIINDEQIVNFDYGDKYVFESTKTKLNSLALSNFQVYRDESNKQAFGTLSLNASKDQMMIFKDKVFILEFKSKQNTDWKQTEDLFGELLNPQDNYNEAYATPEVKRIYVPFEQLYKFRLDGFQEKIKYTLDSIEVVSSGSFEPYSEIIKPTYKSELSFAYSFDWTSYQNTIKLVDQLYSTDTTEKYTKKKLLELSKSSTSPIDIPYSINNLNTLLDFQFDAYNASIRYKNAQDVDKPKDKTFNLKKNGILQSTNFFMPRELMNTTIFKISETQNIATVSKDLSSIVGLNKIDPNDVVLWLTCELDLDSIRPLDYTELADIPSRIRVPVSIANLKKEHQLNDVDFLFDNICGKQDYQQYIFSKIKSNVKFNLSLDGDILTLQVQSRNNDLKLTNKLWMHDNSLSRSAYLANCTMFVNWVQPADDNVEKLSYENKQKLDDLTNASTSVGYKNSYDLKIKPEGTFDRDGKTFKTARDIIDYPLKEEDIFTRLYGSEDTIGINKARSRIFSLNPSSDGTWNVIGKVNDKPDDYRFYAFANHHVWISNKTSGIANYDSDKEIIYFTNGKTVPHLLAPTISSKTDNPISPIYKSSTEQEGPEPTGNMFDFHIPESESPITFKLVENFYKTGTNALIKGMKNNLGQDVSSKNDDQKNDSILDMVICEVDFAPIFKTFENKDLSKMIYNDKPLTEREQRAIQHFLDFKDLDTLTMSDLSLYMTSFTNLNFYISTIPKRKDADQNPYSYVSGRYREYIMHNNSIKLKRTYNPDKPLQYSSNPYGLEKDSSSKPPKVPKTYTNRPTLETETRYYDIQSGSSGSGVYDYQGNVVAIDTQGGFTSSSNYVIIDTPKYSFMGTKDTIYNNKTFYSRINKLSYLYPDMYSNIFNKKR